MRGDFIERDEDEGALGEAGMRNLKVELGNDEIAVEENVEIEGAGAVGGSQGAVAAVVALDGEQSMKKLVR